MTNRNHEGNQFRAKQHLRDMDRDAVPLDEHDEEYAAEIAPGVAGWIQNHDVNDVAERDTGRSGTLGWVALAFAIVSLFLWPIIMGPTAAVLGIYAYFQGQRAMGLWSMVIGAAAFFFFGIF